MAIQPTSVDPTLDPVTGIPLDASYATQYQVPLGSQPINLDELNAQGKQGNWLYPDNLPPVVARLQARDLTNPGNAQDLSTDGKRNLNVNIAASAIPSGGGSSPTPVKYRTAGGQTVATLVDANDRGFLDDVSAAAVIYGVTWWAALDPNSTPVLRDVTYRVYLAPSAQLSHHVFCGFGGWSIVGAGITADLKGDSQTILFPAPIDRALTWPSAADVLLVFETANGAIFCGGSALTG